MTRDRLAKLLQHPSTSDPELISSLEEIVARFPYYTNAHILLTMQYRMLDHIRYDSQLRKTSVYVPDRAVLRKLVLTEEEIPFPNSIQASDEPVIVVEPAAVAPTTNENRKQTVAENIETQPETSEIHPKDEKLDPRDVIEQRLKELQNQEQLVRDQLIDDTSLKEPIIVPIKGVVSKDAEIEIHEPISHTPSIKETPIEPVEQKGKIEVEPTLTDSKSIEPVREPIERQEPVSEAQEASEPKSFSDWLKAIPKAEPKPAKQAASRTNTPAETFGDYFGVDKPVSTADKDLSAQTESIIDKFIREEPRIVPSKSEFYSPGNMARKSAQEHEDLISETLARIYAQQGNLAKAISTYERLALKLPQKKAYFASLIEDLISRS